MEVPADDFECGICREPLNEAISLSDGTSVDFCCFRKWKNASSENERFSPTLNIINAVNFTSDAIMSLTNTGNNSYIITERERDKWTSLLREAVKNGNIEAVINAIAHGADVGSMDWDILCSAIFTEGMYTMLPCTETNFERGGDINGIYISPDIFKILIMNGADPNTLFDEERIGEIQQTDIMRRMASSMDYDIFVLLLDGGLNPMYGGGWMMCLLWDLKHVGLFNLFASRISDETQRRGWILYRLVCEEDFDGIKALVGASHSPEDFVCVEDSSVTNYLLSKIVESENDEIFDFLHTQLFSHNEGYIFFLFYLACIYENIARMRAIHAKTPMNLDEQRLHTLIKICFSIKFGPGLKFLAEIGIDVIDRAKKTIRKWCTSGAFLASSLIHTMLEIGLDVNFDDGLLLNYVCKYGFSDAVDLILKNPNTDKSLMKLDTLIFLASNNDTKRLIRIIGECSIPRDYLVSVLRSNHKMSDETVECFEQRIAELDTGFWFV
jgi:hypothetical protein